MDDTNSLAVVPVPNTRVLANGAVYDNDRGRIVKMSGGTAPINKDNASELAKRRHEITRQKIAKAVADRSRLKNPAIQGPSDAVADAAGMLWNDIVTNPDAPARERRETWQAISKYAGHITDLRGNETQDTGTNGTNSLQDTIASAIVQAIQKLREQET